MNNEVLARAISGIDDDLVAEAFENHAKKSHVRKWIVAGAAAACIILISSIALLTQYKVGFSIMVYGNSIAEKPIAVDTPAVAADAYRNMQDIISIPLEITGKGDVEIFAIDGSVAVSNVKTYDLIYSGQSCTIKGPVTAWWNILQPDTSQTYRLHLNADVTLLLSYDQSTAQWLLKQQ